MAESPSDQYRRVLARQLTMNEQTWARLCAHGVTEASLLRLDFAFLAPDQRAAEALRTILVEQTDYDVTVQPAPSSSRHAWSVTGTTQGTTVSLVILDQWVDWMVTAGAENDCEFDGWGTRI
jgi:hypothetical protein